ncbi:hypothetical protein PAXINDRAFT_101752 [Paxillus involutus ATCC 200175]|uniref:Uncharacterized protein n=1 Tax=Paxillus involutus ATCC 200175 TaxID=664439 RepID=A0A0C9T667_PAXIN|nr:hypothetical protein PAXINDRAFT_101752 [Paxillus involutus ATCC 200175]
MPAPWTNSPIYSLDTRTGGFRGTISANLLERGRASSRTLPSLVYRCADARYRANGNAGRTPSQGHH